jgi:hypothetical protein
MREFEDGHYWVQVSSDSETEIALYDHGSWRLYGHETAETEDLYRIGRRVIVPADAFEIDIDIEGEGNIVV